MQCITLRLTGLENEIGISQNRFSNIISYKFILLDSYRHFKLNSLIVRFQPAASFRGEFKASLEYVDPFSLKILKCKHLKWNKSMRSLINWMWIPMGSYIFCHLLVHFFDVAMKENRFVILFQRHKRFPPQNSQILRHDFGIGFNRFDLIELRFNFALEIYTNSIRWTFRFCTQISTRTCFDRFQWLQQTIILLVTVYPIILFAPRCFHQKIVIVLQSKTRDIHRETVQIVSGHHSTYLNFQ